MTGKIDRPEDKHEPGVQEDLNPDANAGQNWGRIGPHPEIDPGARATAFDIKELHARLGEYNDDDLKRIPIMPPGSRLEQGATYIDLHGDRREFTARGDMESGPENWYVPKAEVDYPLWNRLIGVENPARLDRAGG